MQPIDDIARINKALWEAGGGYSNDGGTIPRLDVDVAAMRAYADGTAKNLPEPFSNSYPDRMTRDAAGKRVLCLASG
jgi:hypothetical protein